MAAWERVLAKPKVAINRAQVWEVDFEPHTRKEEPGKRARPALVIQTHILNGASHATTIVIPGTIKVYRDTQSDGFPLRVSVGKLGSMKHETDLLVDQIRTIANPRLMGDKPLAELSRAHMKRVEDALRMLTGE